MLDNITYINDDFIDANTNFAELIGLLKKAFASSSIEVPLRHHHELTGTGEKDKATLLLMPAWNPGAEAGVKLVTVNPNNSHYKLPSIQGLYIYFDTRHGGIKALLAASALTAKRTAAASALASGYLSVRDASSMLMIGTGTLSANLIKAHVSVRPIKKVFVWGRNMDKAYKIKQQLTGEPYAVEVVKTIEEKIAEVDIISCATLSKTPLIPGQLLRPGQHLDLVGSYKQDMREADNNAILRSALFIDSYQGALHEAGELAIPLKEGLIAESDIKADLFELCSEKKFGRSSREQITLFKSVGHAIEDLVAAGYFYQMFDS